MVRKVGLEPTPLGRDLILSQARLPFRHFRMVFLFLHTLLPGLSDTLSCGAESGSRTHTSKKET